MDQKNEEQANIKLCAKIYFDELFITFQSTFHHLLDHRRQDVSLHSTGIGEQAVVFAVELKPRKAKQVKSATN